MQGSPKTSLWGCGFEGRDSTRGAQLEGSHLSIALRGSGMGKGSWGPWDVPPEGGGGAGAFRPVEAHPRFSAMLPPQQQPSHWSPPPRPRFTPGYCTPRRVPRVAGLASCLPSPLHASPGPLRVPAGPLQVFLGSPHILPDCCIFFKFFFNLPTASLAGLLHVPPAGCVFPGQHPTTPSPHPL